MRRGYNTVHFGPDKVEITNQRLRLGSSVDAVISAEMSYPRQLPAADWKEQFQVVPMRVGFRVGW